MSMTQRQGRRGRKPKPINDTEKPVGCIAAQLRKLKERSGDPSYERLQALCNASRGALAEAASSNGSFPTWNVAGEYVRSCLLYVGRDEAYIDRVLGKWKPYWQKQERVHNPDSKAVDDSGRVRREMDATPPKALEQEPEGVAIGRKEVNEPDGNGGSSNGWPKMAVVAIVVVSLSVALALVGLFFGWWRSSSDEPKTWSVTIVGTYSNELGYHLGTKKYRSPDTPGDTDGDYYSEGEMVQIVCQKRDGRETPPDSVTGKTSRVWDKTAEGFWISDMYTNLPKTEGDIPPNGIPIC